jgi:hypothetical protein
VDPSANHFGFVFWGSASDSAATNNGNDDNTHYAGILGSGAEPLNPRKLTAATPTATPVANVIEASWDGTRVTAKTSGVHNFTVGQNVYLSDVTATSYQGTYPVAFVPDDTHFKYALASNPGTYTYGTAVSRTATVSSVVAGLVTTVLSHDFSVGDYVNLSGFTTSFGCNGNGTYQVASVPDATSFTLTSYASTCTGGYATATSAIAAASWTSGKVSVTTSSAHKLVLGQYVSIANIYPAGYNGTYLITGVVSPTQFSYDLTTDPGGAYSASAVPGMVTATTLNPVYLSGTPVPLTTSVVPYNSDSPQDGVIHVRLDLARSYNASAHQASLTMKAYVADRFGFPNTCTVGDFKNLSRDLSEQCTQRVSIEQDGIVINDVSGPALASVYFGFTAARGTSSGDNQNVVISNLLMRSQ